MNEDSPFQIQHWEEPEIEFNGGLETSPKRGLLKYGPRLEEDKHHTITLGIIGDRDTIRNLQSLLRDMEIGIHPGNKDQPQQVPFPGVGEDSRLKISIHTKRSWRFQIRDDYIDRVEDQDTVRERMDYFLDIVEDKIDLLDTDNISPNVVIVCIPQRVMDACTPADEEYSQIQSEGSNLHNRIKLMGMERRLPTQLIKPSTLDVSKSEKRAKRAWNLTVGMLYKSQEGHPWKTREIEEGVCYAGISFYRVGGNNSEVRAALAHVFRGKDHVILQSDPLEDIEEDNSGQPHLSEEGAEAVVSQILEHYRERKGMYPRRFVLHKTSEFWDRERDGARSAATKIEDLDLVTIRGRPDIRVYPDSDFPAVRGTVLSVPEDDLHYLYTTGFVPEQMTYEGSNVPRPIEVVPDPEQCPTPADQLCREILFFTKLDWNTSEYSVRMPATLGVAKSVGKVLSEPVTEEMDDVRPEYYYYM